MPVLETNPVAVPRAGAPPATPEALELSGVRVSSPLLPPAAPGPPAAPSRPRRITTLAAAVMLAVVVAAGASLVVTQRDQSRRLDESVGSQQRAASAVAALEADVRGLEAALAALRSQLAAAEAATPAVLDAAAVARTVLPSVLEVQAGTSLGTAWVVSSAGGSSRLVTAEHVVAGVYDGGGRRVVVTRPPDRYVATIIRADPGDDLAVLAVDAVLPALTTTRSGPGIGDPVLAAGSSLGLQGSVSTGVVGGIRVEGGVDYLQFTAPVSPGNSGGPLVDRFGRVLGVVVMKAVEQGAEGLAFAVPMERVCSALSVC